MADLSEGALSRVQASRIETPHCDQTITYSATGTAPQSNAEVRSLFLLPPVLTSSNMAANSREAWERLAKLSSSCLNMLSPAPPLSRPKDVQQDLPTLTLHVPADYSNFLYDLDLPPHVLKQSMERLRKTLKDLKDIHIQSYRDICQQTALLDAASTSSNHLATYESLRLAQEASFQRQLLQMREKTIAACKPTTNHTAKATKRNAFKSVSAKFSKQSLLFDAVLL